ncbi:uncharacterized protein PODANS_1_15430 [Podospora anserina S mat+]|uniref:Podospora anserina S mat+ genomic DNA chromosome 1, supercontig 4 n=1 Tax=Podospora anserina (strain S / ATCC MYA-4624 / DSM 980 / FGSC 10383) TaxID=515849 RepID=B2ATC9_PODAN|nr:uncharacterized protein PODANS_1_15430 [Podospora anserina S mat+]CAP67652.1 unnamed protein product [Podospora anserina S mat+]CDP23911.1 Putative protein of unknown function [Podospora anserina S mat+]
MTIAPRTSQNTLVLTSTQAAQRTTMLSASKLHNRCPGCRAQVLGFYDALLQPRNIASRPFVRPRATPVTAASRALSSRSRQPNPVRPFSTTKRVFNEVPPTEKDTESQSAEKEAQTVEGSGEATAEEIELLVRQARQTFGNTLPKDYFSGEEYKVYERLYGPPLRETAPEDVGLPLRDEHGEAIDETTPEHALFRETEHGDYEQVQYRTNPAVPGGAVEAADTAEPGFPGELAEEATDLEAQAEQNQPVLSDAHIDYLNITANNSREYHALIKLQRDFEAAAALQPMDEIHEEIREDEGITERDYPREEEEIEEDDEYDPGTEFEVDESRDTREHPFTSMGKFKTSPSTIYLPKASFVEPISTLLKRTDSTHIRQCGEENLGGPGFPHGPGSPRSKVNVPQKGLGLQAGVGWMSEIEADTFLATIMPAVYATAMSTLVEVRKRLGPEWLRGLLARDGGPRVLDVGAGGAALAAWQQVLQAEWDILRENGEVSDRYPPGKKTTVVGNDHLRHRVSRFLHNTTFLPRLPDYLHVANEHDMGVGDKPAPRKQYDVIIASHLLMPLDKEYKRKDMLDNLWKMLNPEGGVLILLEKGHPRGFEAVADARDRLLDNFILAPHSEPHADEVRTSSQHVREPGMIIAPCTNHQKCPMYHQPGFSPGRKDFCHFQQRYIRPPFLQQILGASRRSHEDIAFSYVAVRRGAYPEGHTPSADFAAAAASAAADVSFDAGPLTTITSDNAPVYVQGKEASDLAFKGYEAEDSKKPHPLSLPRNILPPLKRHGHVTLDVCTPQATIERWVVSKSFSKQAYRDARKAQWGDLWALGAKTRTLRNVRLGRAGQDAVVVKDAGVRSRRALEAAGRKRDKVVEINVHPQFGVTGAYEKHPRGKTPEQRRSRNGRKVRIENLMEEMGANELPDPDDIEDAEYLKSKDL